MKSTKSKEYGKWGEQLAYDHLVSQGFAIHKQNWRMGHLEIDIIAEDDKNIVFVEVKTRNDDLEDPIDTVDAKKIRNMVNAANAYIQQHDTRKCVRFDIIGIIGSPETGVSSFVHIEDAFEPPLTRF